MPFLLGKLIAFVFCSLPASLRHGRKELAAVESDYQESETH
ncbi:MAG: hypothetical protein ACTS7E_01970 [Arsenophonus sp. NC-CH8-MAG3]